MTTLLIMCGIPGSGKSTWARNFANQIFCNTAIISRDNIRFSLLEEGEDYFSHESEVTKLFYQQIQEAIDNEYTYVIADATHNTYKARAYLLDHLNVKNVNIIPVFFPVSVEQCKVQNAQRSGRACVPDEVIENMAKMQQEPHMNEKYRYHDIWTVRPLEGEERYE